MIAKSLSQTSSFRVRSTVGQWSNPGAVVSSVNACVCVCVHTCATVLAFNPSVICFLLPPHECRDFSIRSLWKDIQPLAVSLNTSAAAGQEKSVNRTERQKKHTDESYTATESVY